MSEEAYLSTIAKESSNHIESYKQIIKMVTCAEVYKMCFLG